ncbi:MAG: SAM-dependent methyltransferase [Chlamydiales bacterium]|jgi:SAM-dependent methyltransferase
MADEAHDDSGHSAHEQNRASWNAVTAAHNSHKADQAQFLRDGGSTVFPDELELLGDLHGRKLAHLQCNCGQDSLSLVRAGAEVTGVDISDEALTFARGLARDTGLGATFVRSDVLDWLDTTDERFDLAFASYGTIGWLDDLDRWSRGVQRILVPGGRLVLLEFHPLAWSYAGDGGLAEPYFIPEPIVEAGGVNDYVSEALAPSGFVAGAEAFSNPEPCTSYQYTSADTITSIARAGLRIERVSEYPYSNGCEIFDGMERLPGNRFGMPKGVPSMPLMLGVTAKKDPEV